MDYYKILNFSREPFSNSPDPGFFYKVPQHVACVQNLEISIRLRRGLNVVLGDVGTGKTTLCRRLIASLDNDENLETHLIFDPYFGTPMDFLSTVARLFGCAVARENPTEWELKESIKHYLFRRGVDEGGTVVLIIDEGQKIPPFCLEILREFLNYETNEAKLLQVLIFAQTEFEDTLKAQRNFGDRVNLFLKLGPLSFKETKEMIRFRLNKASDRGRSTITFTNPAMRAVFRATGGYPRQIIHVCHRVILSLILQNRTTARYSLVKACAAGEGRPVARPVRWGFAVALLMAVGLWIVFDHGMIPSMKKHAFLSAVVAERPAERVSMDVPAREPLMAATPPALVEKEPVPPAVEKVEPPLPAAVEKTVETVKDEPVQPAREPMPPPEFLGRISVQRGDTLSAMVAGVYGEMSTGMVSKVAGANPHIRNVNQIALGQVIAFPRLEPAAPGSAWEGFAVRVAATSSLEAAYRFVMSAPAMKPPMRIVTSMAEDGTMKYHVVLSRRYREETSAGAAIEQLPLELAAAADVFRGPPPGAVMLTTWE